MEKIKRLICGVALLLCMVFARGLGYANPPIHEHDILIEGARPVETNCGPDMNMPGTYSGGLLMMLTDMEPTSKGYYANYEFSVKEEGYYLLEIASTPTGAHGSPYWWKLDDEEWIHAKRAFYWGPISAPGVRGEIRAINWTELGEVKLKQGKHGLKLKCEETRDIDKSYAFYVDCITLKKIEQVKLTTAGIESEVTSMPEGSMPYPVSNVLDYNPWTFWTGAKKPSESNYTIDVKLSKTAAVKSIKIYSRKVAGHPDDLFNKILNYRIKTWNNETGGWKEVESYNVTLLVDRWFSDENRWIIRHTEDKNDKDVAVYTFKTPIVTDKIEIVTGESVEDKAPVFINDVQIFVIP